MSTLKFEKPLNKAVLLKAILQYRLEQWEKGDKKGASPTIESITEEFSSDLSGETIIKKIAGVDPRAELGTTVIDKSHAKAVGAVLLAYEKIAEEDNDKKTTRPDIKITSGNSEYILEPKELSGYLQSAATEQTVSYDTYTVEAWVKQFNIGLTGAAKDKRNIIDNEAGAGITGTKRGEDIAIETRDGQRRIVSNGVMTEPLKGGVYGGIKDAVVGDGDLLDVYVENSIVSRIAKGADKKTIFPQENETIFVMQQMKTVKDDKGNSSQVADEPKIGFATSVDAFKQLQASTYDFSVKSQAPVASADPSEFEKYNKEVATANKIRQTFKNNQGAYFKFNREQFEAFKDALKQKPSLEVAEFVQAYNNGAKHKKIEEVTPSPLPGDAETKIQLAVKSVPQPVPPAAGTATPLSPEQREAALEYTQIRTASGMQNAMLIQYVSDQSAAATDANVKKFNETLKSLVNDTAIDFSKVNVESKDAFKKWLADNASTNQNISKLNDAYKGIQADTQQDAALALTKTVVDTKNKAGADIKSAVAKMDGAFTTAGQSAKIQADIDKGLGELGKNIAQAQTTLEADPAYAKLDDAGKKAASTPVWNKEMETFTDKILEKNGFDVKGKASPVQTNQPAVEVITYTVQSGDSLSKIARDRAEFKDALDAVKAKLPPLANDATDAQQKAHDLTAQITLAAIIGRASAENAELQTGEARIAADKALAGDAEKVKKMGVGNIDRIYAGMELIVPTAEDVNKAMDQMAQNKMAGLGEMLSDGQIDKQEYKEKMKGKDVGELVPNVTVTKGKITAVAAK